PAHARRPRRTGRRLAVAPDALTRRARRARVTRSVAMTTVASTSTAMPPGPTFPRWVQTLGFMAGGARYLEWCRRRYGDVVTMGTVFDQRFVMLFDPRSVKEGFQGS